MIRYILKRIILVLPVLLGISLIIFTMLYFTPGDPSMVLLSADASPEMREQLRRDLGLDLPFWVQYFNYIKGIVTRGDFGTSWITLQSVSVELFQRYPISVRLALFSGTIATLLGLTLGIISAVRQYTIFDNIANFSGLIAYSMPSFWQGMLFIVFFAVHLRWFPASGIADWTGWVLPSLTIGTTNTALVMRMTRSSILEVLRQDYITTARAKGIREGIVILKHALGNALIPIVTIIGLAFGTTLSGAIITERVFSIPGIGMLLVDSINARNFPMVQGIVLFSALWFCLINLIIDLVYGFIDPRIKAQYMRKKRKIAVVKEAEK